MRSWDDFAAKSPLPPTPQHSSAEQKWNIRKETKQHRRTLFYKLGPLDPLPNGLLIPQRGVGAEGAVQAGAEVAVAEGVLPSEVE